MDADGPGSGAPRPEDRPPLDGPTQPRWGAAAARWSALGLGATAILSFLAALGVSVLVVLALGMGRRPAQERSPEEILLLAVTSDGALLVALFALGRRLLALRPADLGFRRPALSSLGYAVAMAAGLWVLSIGVNALQISAFGPHPQPLIVTVGAHSGALALAMDLLTGAVVAPFAEETLFRGLVFGGLAQRMPLPAAAVVSALLFALSHGVGVLAPIFVLGLGLAYVYARTRTIWAAMLAHALVNAVSLVLLFALPKG